MIALDDWSDLITVNYKSGYGGEFFAFLLYESYHGEIEYIKYEDNQYRYDFTSIDPLKRTPLPWFNRLDHERDIGFKSVHMNENMIKDLSIIKKIYYDDDRKKYIKNLQIYFSENYFPKHKEKNITKLHNHISNKNSIFIQEVFSKSKNYDLVCKNESDHFLFKILFFYKVLVPHIVYYSKDKILLTRLGVFEYITLEKLCTSMGIVYVKSNETGIKIDVFDLFINQKNELNLNEKKLKKYRDDIFYILDKFEIDVSHSYTQYEIYEIIKKYLKKNKTFEKQNG
jgi:hypothetical protein